MIASILLLAAPQAPFHSASPLILTGPDQASPGWVAELDQHSIQVLTEVEEIRLKGLPIDGQSLIDVDLVQLDWKKHRPSIHLDGRPAPEVLEQAMLSVWSGVVAGEPDSEVLLWFSSFGSHGWVRSRGQLTHFIGRPDRSGDWTPGEVLIIPDQDLSPWMASNACAAVGSSSPVTPPTNGLPGTCALVECPVALECDTQFASLFNNNGAAAASYVAALWTAIGSRYEAQVNTILTFPYVNIPTNGVDPWQTQDNGGSAQALLVEFRLAWAGNIPGGAKTAMLMSGASIGGGYAYLGVLCNPAYAFGVSGNLSGSIPFPVAQGPSNWDFIVNAHELGHNFNAPHTHDTCPPIDQCAPPGFFGQCQTSQSCTGSGTIMSYCHQCQGGTSNNTTLFHPAIADIMKGHAGACLPSYIQASASTPSLLTPGAPTPVSLTINIDPPTPPAIRFAEDGVNYATVAMTMQSPGVYTGLLPPAACGTSPRYYYSITDPNCGNRTLPDGAPGMTYTATAGSFAVVSSQDFEGPHGWTAGAPGDTATGGQWELVDPIPSAAQPGDDHSAPGTLCWVTGQHSLGAPTGTSDVDGGVTTLLSPLMDLSGFNDPVVTYWRWFSNDQGPNPNEDTMVVQVSNNGGNSWVTMETVGPNSENSGGWIQASHSVASFVVPSPFMRFRFRASDTGGSSIVEAAIDDFELSDLDCGSVVGTTYCTPAVPNSTGLPARLSAQGSAVAAANNLQLTASDLPNGQFAYFNASLSQGSVPNPGGSQGLLCLGAPIARFRSNILIVANGEVAFQPDLTQIPLPPTLSHAVQPGETWNWQLWFRDSNPTPTSNFSDGLQVAFQ